MELAIVLLLGLVIVAKVYIDAKNRPNAELDSLRAQLAQSQLREQQQFDAFIASENAYKAKSEAYDTLLGQKKSSEVRLGFLAEQIAPVLDVFPYKDDEIHHMGQPLDLLVYRQDEIVFIEIKTGTSQLSSKQKRIKQLIQEGKVRFEEHRITTDGYKIKP